MKKLTIVIPAYKEGENLALCLTRVLNALRATQIPFEIMLMVDVVPHDNTQEVAQKIASHNEEINLHIRNGRQGVGSAIRRGIFEASGEIIIPVMGDFSESTNDIVTLACTAQKGYDIVIGNRFMKKNTITDYPALKYCANRLCNLLARLIFGIPTSDITNAFKAYSSHLLKDLNLKSTGYSIFLELPLKAYLNGAKNLTEVSVNHTAIRKRQGLRIFRDGIGYCLSLISILFHQNRRRHLHLNRDDIEVPQ